MNLFVYNDGHVVTSEAGKPVNVPLDNLLMCVTDPQVGQMMMFDGTMWRNQNPSDDFVKLLKAASGEGIYFAKQPENVTKATGENATFSVDVIGVGLELSYQWQNKLKTASSWSDSTVTGNKTFSITVEATAARYNYEWRCAVTYTLDGESVTEYSATAAILEPAESEE